MSDVIEIQSADGRTADASQELVRPREYHEMRYAGFWRRFVAYCLDALPITLFVSLVFYYFLGFDTTLDRYLSRKPGDLDAKREFIVSRNWIRNLSLTLYLAYCGLAEASLMRGTLGKWLVGIEVINTDGTSLTRTQAAKRNSAKALSFLALGLGCLWIAWSKNKQGWHDTLAETYVVRRSGNESPSNQSLNWTK